jgi:site-specific recombinase XerD
VDIKQGTNSIMGQGAKERRVRMGKVTQLALMRWWLLSKEYELPGLWLTEEKTPLHRNGVQIMIRRLFRRAGVTGVKIGPHTVRHTFAINSFRNGAREFDVQVILGHSTLTMTRAYMSDIGSDDAMKAHALFSPVDNLIK